MHSLELPSCLPAAHRNFIAHALEVFQSDPRILGVAAGGSILTGEMDEFSDVDLLVVTQPQAQQGILRERTALAGRLGTLLSGFSGEHVGEPRLLICLYDDPLLHVDLKFVSLDDLHERVEDPLLLWARDASVAKALARGTACFPQPDIAWIEARFWVWMHYGAGKIGRGELFEAIDFISFIRSAVLGRLALRRAGARPQGVRRIEMRDGVFAAALRETVPAYDASDCLRALEACMRLYRELRADTEMAGGNPAAEAAVQAYVADVRKGLQAQ